MSRSGDASANTAIRQQMPNVMMINAACKPGPRAKASESTTSSALCPRPLPEAAPSAPHDSNQEARQRSVAPRARVVPAFTGRRRHELKSRTHAYHHDMTIEAGHSAHALCISMPERFIVALEANLVGASNRLVVVDAELYQPADTK